MKTLIINPNSNQDMTESIKELVKNFKTEYLDVDVIGMKNTPEFVDSKETIERTYEEVKETILENEREYDIFILGCHLDPNLEKLRRDTEKIVIGIGEASILFCKILGKRFSIVGSSDKTVKLKEDMTARYGARDDLDYVGYPDENSKKSLVEKLSEESVRVIEKYNSDAIVLGCAGFVNFDAYIEREAGKDVIDGVIAALIIADGYAKYKKYKKIN